MKNKQVSGNEVTTSKTSHTPTPWKSDSNGTIHTDQPPLMGLPTRLVIANVFDEKHNGNAAFIVRAVNAFESMKVALEAVKRGTEPYEGYILTMVNQAITKAEGSQAHGGK